jgi:hypothetical protein
MRAEDFRVQLEIDDIFSDQEILKMWVSQSIMSRPVAVRMGYVPSQQFGYRSYEAIHVLIEKQPGGVCRSDKFVLVDWDFNGYGKCFFRYILEHLKRVYGLQHPIKLNATVAIYWDADYIGGITGLFEDDTEAQWREELAGKPEPKVKNPIFTKNWDSFMRSYIPSFLTTDAHVYYPYWNKTRTKSLLNIKEEVSVYPDIWDNLESLGKVRIKRHNPWAKGRKGSPDTVAFSNPFAQLHDDADLLLDYDFFVGRRACGDQVNHVDITSPKYVSAHLTFCSPRTRDSACIGGAQEVEIQTRIPGSRRCNADGYRVRLQSAQLSSLPHLRC